MRTLIGAFLILFSTVSSHAYDVGNDVGGLMDYYVQSSEVMRDTNESVRFNGLCASACTLYIQLPNSCVTPAASFYFHKPFGGTEEQVQEAEAYLMAHYPKWVQVWIEAKGGLQTKPIIMPYSIIKKHMRKCHD